MRIHLVAAALVLLGSSCSAEEPAAPDASASSSPAAPTESTTPAADPPPDPCDLLEPFQLKRMFPEPSDYAKATWTHELMGKDGNFYGCVGTLRDFNYIRFGFAVTPNAYLREYKQGKVLGEGLSPTESDGLGDRGYIREAFPQGYESMAKSAERTVYVHSIGAKDYRDVVAALRYLVGQSTPAMTQSPVQLREPCPAVDSPEVTGILGDAIDVAVGTEERGSVFCAYHDPATRTQLELSAYTLDPTAAALYRGSMPKVDRSRGETLLDPPPGRVTVRQVDPDFGDVEVTSFDPRTGRLSVVSLTFDYTGATKEAPIGGNPKALFAYADEFIAAHG